MNLGNFKIFFALILSAASALIYEVVVTDFLFYYFAESSYSIATVVSVFLFGLGIGSFFVYKTLNKIKDKKLVFGLCQVVIGVYSAVVLANLGSLISSFSSVGIFMTSFLILLIPTLFLGAIFPLATSLVKAEKKEVVGLVYFVDLVGAVFGSLIAGFLLIPYFGNKITVFVAVFFNLASALAVIKGKRKIFVVILLVILAVFFVNTISGKSGDLFNSNSPYGNVRVDSYNGCLYIDSRCQCSFYDNDTTEKSIVKYSFEGFSSKNVDVLNIGLGCGLTLSEIMKKTDDIVDVVEINPVVVRANKMFSDVLKSQDINLIIDDGFRYVRYDSKSYDVIIIDVEEPSIVHSSNLYTAEFFRDVKNSLDENGVFGLWVYPCNSREYYDILYFSLKESFEHIYLLEDSILIASDFELPYRENEYIPSGEKKLNTLDKKTLSTIFFDKCWIWDKPINSID